MSSTAIVVTTINAPTPAMTALQQGAVKADARFIVIGDSKSPAGFAMDGVDYFDVDAQKAAGLEFGRIVPTRHYARKNVGYLLALKGGADVLIETDDDNIPVEEFWLERNRAVSGTLVTDKGWRNVYADFSQANIWPRGLPLDRVRAEQTPISRFSAATLDCPIQQGLADDNPDVDAIYRLVLPLPIQFDRREPVILDTGSWCPFNSQNTTWWRDAFPLLYLPFHCSFRMTDIWRSFVAQRLAWECGWRLMFHNASVYQDRNEHDLMRDFADEIPGYLHNERIRATLEDLNLGSGPGALLDNLLKAYEALIQLDVIGHEERPLIQAWCSDFSRLG